MNTPLSLESQIEKLMDLYKVRQEPLGMYARGLFGVSLSGTTISSGLRGTRPFANGVARMLYDTLKEIQRAQQLLDPLPIDWTDVRACLPILENLRAGEPIIPPAAATAPAPDPWSLLAELAPGNIDEVCAARGLQRSELLTQLAAAREKLHAVTESLAAGNADRGQLNEQLAKQPIL